MNKITVSSPTHHPSLVSRRAQAALLHQVYQDCFATLSKSNEKIALINAHLARIDPEFIGKKRNGSSLKYLIRRISKKNEIKTLTSIKKLNKKISEKYSKKTQIIEKELQEFLKSDIRSRPSAISIAIWIPKACATGMLRVVKSLIHKNASKPLEQPCAPQTMIPTPSPAESRKLILDFIGDMPIFKENPCLRETLEKQFQIAADLRVTIKDADTIQIDCLKQRIEIDLALPVAEEECQQMDPDNPLLQTKKPITVNDLQQLGSIDSSWWEWLKVKKYPTIGPLIILKREGNALHFKKGVSLLDTIEFKHEGIAFKAIFLEKICNWKFEDFLKFLSKFKSIPA